MKTNIYVVVVDDNPDEGLLITRIFSRMDRAVDLAMLTNGEEALQLLKSPNSRQPDIIIMDNKMPGAKGIEVLRQLNEYPHIRELPIILMSAEFTKKELREAYRAGARSCVEKGHDSVVWNRNLRGILAYWLEINKPAGDAFEDY